MFLIEKIKYRHVDCDIISPAKSYRSISTIFSGVEVADSYKHVLDEMEEFKGKDIEFVSDWLTKNGNGNDYILYSAFSIDVFKNALQARGLWVRSDISIYRRRWQPRVSVH